MAYTPEDNEPAIKEVETVIERILDGSLPRAMVQKIGKAVDDRVSKDHKTDSVYRAIR